MLQRLDLGSRGLRGVFQHIRARRIERLLVEPNHTRIKLPRHLGNSLGRGDHVAAADVQLVFERKRDRHGRNGFLQRAIESFDAPHARPSSRGKRQNRVARPDDSGCHLTRVAAESLVRPHYPLHWKTERRRARAVKHRHGLQVFQEARSAEPGHVPAAPHDVVASQRADGKKIRMRGVQMRKELAELRLDSAKNIRIVAHQIHLVHRDREVRNPEERSDVGMPARLSQHSVARVDQYDRQFGGRRSGRHVARILLVTGRVGDDELPPSRRKIAISDINGNALLPLGAQTIRQQREIDGPRRTIHRRLGHRLQLILVDALRIVEKTADQRRLTVVHAAGRRESQQILRTLPVDQHQRRHPHHPTHHPPGRLPHQPRAVDERGEAAEVEDVEECGGDSNG